MIDRPRGTRDFTQDEMNKRRWYENKMRNVFNRYGYGEISTPTFEHLDLFTLKSGDSIIEETYTFRDKSQRQLALRPEFTAPVMRFYVDRYQMDPKPLKFYYFGNCFRYDRPQMGRYREFWQFGCEIIGTDRPEAIAELIALAYDVISECGLKKIILRVGNLDILRTVLDSLGARRSEILRFIDKKEYDLLANYMTDKEHKELMKFIKTKNMDDIEYDEKNNMKKVLSFLEEFSIPYNIDFSIARGLDYYKGTVFEIDAPVLGAEKQLCGGGEYNLVPLLGGRPIPTAGFAIGFDRTLLALEKEGVTVRKKTPPVFVIYNGNMIKQAINIVKTLRANGVSAELDLKKRNLKKALDYANKKQFHAVIIVADDEWTNNKILIKDMKRGVQDEVDIDHMINHIISEFNLQ
jgi:histidyl-tRNA synthetase